jgi:hypothetical protein
MYHHTRAVRPLSLSLLALLCAAVPACTNTEDGGSSSCPAGQTRVDGVCQPATGRDLGRDATAGDLGDDVEPDVELDLPLGCEPGERVCTDANTAAVCGQDGAFQAERCASTQLCRDGFCIDSGLLCSPGANVGCNDATSYRVCDDTGNDWEVVDCPATTPNCLGSGQCSSGICLPGQRRCATGDTDAVERCTADGEQWEVIQECGVGSSCDGGDCLSPCEENAKLTSFLGCDYWAADLDNIEEAAAQQFSVSVSNPNDQAVTVTILNGATNAVITETVAAETVRAINLPRLDVNGTGRSRNAFHITTNLPVTMHQFNPSNNVGVYSNDASLLLPTNAAGRSYVVLGWPTGPFGQAGNAHAYATIIAVDDAGPTTVSVTPTVDVVAGGGVNAMLAGTTRQEVLTHGEVLNLQTRSESNRDLSGTRIEADRPIIVFSGHECAFVPDGPPPTPYCDHMEQQLYPVETWGMRYFGAKLAPRGTEIDVWRVVAADESALLTTRPPVSGVSGRTLEPFEVLEFQTNQSFELEATAPVLLGQFMTGSNFPGIPKTCWQPVTVASATCSSLACFPYTCSLRDGECAFTCGTSGDCPLLSDGSRPNCNSGWCEVGTGVGDPAFMLAVPAQQWRDNYIFLTPADYRDDFITVIAPIGTELRLNGEPLLASALIPIGDTGVGVSYHDLSSTTPGSDPARAHTISGSNPFALQVYGYDCDVSYAYPGGLNLEALVEE